MRAEKKRRSQRTVLVFWSVDADTMRRSGPVLAVLRAASCGAEAVSKPRNQWKHMAKAMSKPRNQWEHKAKAVS